MNYSAVITIGIMILSFIWYYASARKRYTGPRRSASVIASSSFVFSLLTSLISFHTTFWCSQRRPRARRGDGFDRPRHGPQPRRVCHYVEGGLGREGPALKTPRSLARLFSPLLSSSFSIHLSLSVRSPNPSQLLFYPKLLLHPCACFFSPLPLLGPNMFSLSLPPCIDPLGGCLLLSALPRCLPAALTLFFSVLNPQASHDSSRTKLDPYTLRPSIGMQVNLAAR